MKPGTIFTLLAAFLLAAGATAALTAPRPVLGQMTIPTRTRAPEPQPTNPPPEPTDDNGGGGGGGNPNPTSPPPQPTSDNGGGGGNPQPTNPPTQSTAVPPQATQPPGPAPTNTAVPPTPTATKFAVVPPAASATPTATVVQPSPSPTLGAVGPAIAFPQQGEPFPTAAPCAMPPTFQTSVAAELFAGPGTDYTSVGLLGAAEVRPIVGRAAFAPWWVIQMDGTGRTGWITDSAGTVQGSTGRVSIVSAPDLDGIAPTPGGTPWVPTPSASCDPVTAPSGQPASSPIRAVDTGSQEADPAVVAAAQEPPSNQPAIIVEAGAAVTEAEPVQAAAAGGEGLDISSETLARRVNADPETQTAELVNELAE